jgi:hypothetical protein
MAFIRNNYPHQNRVFFIIDDRDLEIFFIDFALDVWGKVDLQEGK